MDSRAGCGGHQSPAGTNFGINPNFGGSEAHRDLALESAMQNIGLSLREVRN